jgi:hypothetical protein
VIIQIHTKLYLLSESSSWYYLLTKINITFNPSIFLPKKCKSLCSCTKIDVTKKMKGCHAQVKLQMSQCKQHEQKRSQWLGNSHLAVRKFSARWTKAESLCRSYIHHGQTQPNHIVCMRSVRRCACISKRYK